MKVVATLQVFTVTGSPAGGLTAEDHLRYDTGTCRNPKLAVRLNRLGLSEGPTGGLTVMQRAYAGSAAQPEIRAGLHAGRGGAFHRTVPRPDTGTLQRETRMVCR